MLLPDFSSLYIFPNYLVIANKFVFNAPMWPFFFLFTTFMMQQIEARSSAVHCVMLQRTKLPVMQYQTVSSVSAGNAKVSTIYEQMLSGVQTVLRTVSPFLPCFQRWPPYIANS